MTRERSLTTGVRRTRRLRRRDRYALIAASLTAVSLTASGCMVVHGEREVLPAATRAEAAKAVEQFTTAYNKADAAYDSSLDAAYTAGTLGAIDAARLKAGRVNSPGGNPQHSPLVFSDVKYTIVEKAGWPRWFIADAKGNKGDDSRWLMVFTRGGLSEPWQATYLTLVAPGSVPEFKKDADGFAAAVPADTAELALPPADLSEDYAAYLQSGKGVFADGAYTSVLRDTRAKNTTKPGLVTQYIDQPLTEDDYAPLAVRTLDGGALVFFATHHYTKQTAAPGAAVPTPNRSVQALTVGEVKLSLTMEFVSSGVALDPGTSSGSGKVSMLSRLEGLTGAKGE
ncbi:hypothetical protein OG352_12050 [Streptomyces sp. NBC_01485]|uniref:hypothetical protein n=1 Tax=Streptomyces sp. NBC_01485 TaxID=2903884 RepID=UPI002E316BB4|nr:hypothetical protein [Streptomyces sp. NBC_01485]